LVDERVFEKFKSDMINISKGKVELDGGAKRTFYLNNKEVRFIN
jgi:hypothetical protein